MAEIACISKGTDYLDVELINLDTSWIGGDRLVYYFIRINGVPKEIEGERITGSPSEGGRLLIIGLSPNTTYDIQCIVTDEAGNQLAWLNTNCTTLSGTESYLKALDIGTDYITLQIEGLNGWTQGTCTVEYLVSQIGWYTGEDLENNPYLTSGGWCRITNLSEDTKYNIDCFINNAEGILVKRLNGIFKTKKKELWHWSESAIFAMQNKQKVNKVSHNEWNSLVDYVEKVSKVNLSDIKMTDDYTLTASKFNILRRTIGGLYSFTNGNNSIKDHFNNTGRWDFEAGEKLLGQYLIDVAEYANKIP